MRVERIGRATLYCGDSREILPTIAGIDAVVTDPPYGVGFSYESIDDTPELVRDVVVPIVSQVAQRFGVVVVTPGTRNMFAYPQPYEVGAIYFPAGAGFSRWGFTCSQPILYYGKDPHPNNKKRPNSVQCTETSEKNGHPCPKPIKLMKWLVDRASLPGQTILDPFMGSGSTGVAAVQMGRHFVGIELEPSYFDIACKRIEDAQRQGSLFGEAA